MIHVIQPEDDLIRAMLDRHLAVGHAERGEDGEAADATPAEPPRGQRWPLRRACEAPTPIARSTATLAGV